MSDHFVVTLDAGHLRIYQHRCPPGQSTPGFEAVEAMDFPAGVQPYTNRETDQAGRFQSSQHQAAGSGAPGGNSGGRSGMSIDERLPMKREEGRRRARDLASEVESFFAQRPDATWDFAAGPEWHDAVLGQLSTGVRQRLRQSLTKDLVNQGQAALRSHFAGAR